MLLSTGTAALKQGLFPHLTPERPALPIALVGADAEHDAMNGSRQAGGEKAASMKGRSSFTPRAGIQGCQNQLLALNFFLARAFSMPQLSGDN